MDMSQSEGVIKRRERRDSQDPCTTQHTAAARILVAATTAVVASLAMGGCTRSAGENTQQAPHIDGSAPGYGFAGDRCGLLLDSSVQEAVGADHVVWPYSGTVCQ